VVFVTGHEDFEKSKDAVRWKKLAKSTDTIVVMMGLSRIGIISKQLLSGGMDKKTPVAVTGHEDFEKSKDAVRWKKLAKSTDTIVVMMGLSRIGIISKHLLSGGMDKKTPVAVIQDGTTSKQKMITGTISNIAQKIKQSKIRPPSIIIIGKVVSLSKTIGWRKK